MVQQHIPTDAEKAMKANANSRKRQGARSDKAAREAAEGQGAPDPRPSADLTGPGGDPAEGKR